MIPEALLIIITTIIEHACLLTEPCIIVRISKLMPAGSFKGADVPTGFDESTHVGSLSETQHQQCIHIVINGTELKPEQQNAIRVQNGAPIKTGR